MAVKELRRNAWFEWIRMSLSGVGSDRGPIAILLAPHGCRLLRPDRCAMLSSLAYVSFVSDVFGFAPDASPEF